MLDIKFIRENPNEVKEGCKKKQVKVDIDRVLELDKDLRKFKKIQEEVSAIKNRGSEKIKTGEDKEFVIKDTVSQVTRHLISYDIKEQDITEKIKTLTKEFNNLMLQIPNIPLDDVPIGKDEKDNIVIKNVGKKPKFTFKPKDYLEIAENLDLIDMKRAAKVSGTRFGFLKNQAVLLEFALENLALDVLMKEGFSPIDPPIIIKPEMMQSMGYVERGGEEIYYLKNGNFCLVGTSEQSIGPMHSNEIFTEKDLPKRYLGFSTCFRREAGSYGKDTKGIFRVHQFYKVEMFSFCDPEKSIKEHQFILSLEEKLMKLLKIPYRVVQMCTGDLGDPAVAKYDIESWIPSEERYRETHSTSNCTDFQARRLNIRYRDKTGKLNFVHTLNGTAFATGRTIIAIIENYQQKDGSVKIPKVLQKYLGFKVIPKK